MIVQVSSGEENLPNPEITPDTFVNEYCTLWGDYDNVNSTPSHVQVFNFSWQQATKSLLWRLLLSSCCSKPRLPIFLLELLIFAGCLPHLQKWYNPEWIPSLKARIKFYCLYAGLRKIIWLEWICNAATVYSIQILSHYLLLAFTSQMCPLVSSLCLPEDC